MDHSGIKVGQVGIEMLVDADANKTQPLDPDGLGQYRAAAVIDPWDGQVYWK